MLTNIPAYDAVVRENIRLSNALRPLRRAAQGLIENSEWNGDTHIIWNIDVEELSKALGGTDDGETA